MSSLVFVDTWAWLALARRVLAEGTLDSPGWTAATIDLDRLNALRTSGEMRNNADWARQPGAAGLAQRAQVLTLA